MNSKSQSDACYVCGETKSTGWHFGTITCEACKKFFIRNFEGDTDQIKCVRFNQNCVITKSTRTNCPSCRYKKCLEVGMNPNEKNSSAQAVSFKEISCSICGDASSGLHFGAITCEGCKGFFRRSAKDGQNFHCALGGNCEINSKTRNVCRACRYKRCIENEMSLQNSKIGRQSNLFKQKLMADKSMPGQSTNAIENVKLNVIKTNVATKNETDIEDSLELHIKDFIKNVYSAYKNSIEVYIDFPINLNDEVLPLGFYFQNYQEYNQVFKFFDCHINKCMTYMLDSLHCFQGLNSVEKIKIIANGIHPIRLLQLACNPDIKNYFNTDEQTFQKLVRIFPIFQSIMPYLSTLNELIRGLKLDAKELALYSTLIAFSSAGRGMSMIREYHGLNLEICRALMAYMKLRRNECESCELLIHFGFRFEKLNIQLQTGIYEGFKCLEAIGVKPPSSFCIKILACSFDNSDG